MQFRKHPDPYILLPLKSFSQTPNPEIIFPFPIPTTLCVSILVFITGSLILVTCSTTTYVKLQRLGTVLHPFISVPPTEPNVLQTVEPQKGVC